MSAKQEDIGNIPKEESDRWILLQDIIQRENDYLYGLQILRFLYKYRIVLDASTVVRTSSLSSSSFISQNFPGCEDIYYVNKTLLYDPLKSLQLSQGSWLAQAWDIFQNWLNHARQLYIDFASRYVILAHALQAEAERDATFSRLLEQSRRHRLSRKLGWDFYLKSPITQIQRYRFSLGALLNKLDRSEARHEFDKLEQILRDLDIVLNLCNMAVAESNAKLEIEELRSQMGNAGQRILHDSVQILHRQSMNYKENRFREKIPVHVLVLGKPDLSIIVLKKRSKRDNVNEVAREVIVEVSVFPLVKWKEVLNPCAASWSYPSASR